jgi:hypothetical protein
MKGARHQLAPIAAAAGHIRRASLRAPVIAAAATATRCAQNEPSRFPIKRLAMFCAAVACRRLLVNRPQLAPSTAVLILSSLAGTSAYQLWRPRGAYAYMTNVKNRKTKMTCFGASSMPYNDTRGRARLPSVHCLSCLTRRPVARCCMGPRWREPRSEIGGGWFRVQAGRNVRRSLVARSILGLAASRPKLGKSYFVDRRLLSLTVQHKPLSVRFTLGSFWGRAPL